MRCSLGDNASEMKFVFMPWRFDEIERRLLLEAVSCDGVFVDVGANVGIYSLTVADHFGARGRIVAIEPNPRALSRLRFNLEATHAGRAEWPEINTLECGVGTLAGEFDLHLDPDNLGASSTLAHMPRSGGQAKTDEVLRIACKPLRQILEEQGITRIDAMKLDIEGAEDAAVVPFLATAPDTLLPSLLVIENSEEIWTLDVVGALRARGYAVVVRTRLNTVHRRVRAVA